MVVALDMRTIRWGIVGPGRIAAKVAEDFAHVDGARLVAVASRSLDRAEAFAGRYGIERAYGSYAALVEAADVDVLYVATPHPQHHAVAMEALRHGKALLVEKAFTATVAGARAIVERARASRLFVMEAMWTRFQPAIVEARARIAAGAIGEPFALQADLGVDRPFEANDRLFCAELGGGAMLDLGVYLVSFAQMLFGEPTAMAVQGSLAPTGVDMEASMLLEHAGGRRSTLLMSLKHATPGQARIYGTEGFLDVLPRFHHPETIVVHRKGREPEPVTRPPIGGGYSHELVEVTRCMQEERTESAVMPLEDTLAVQRVLEAACEALGVRHREASAG